MSNSRKHRSEDSKWWKSERKEAHSLRLHGVNLRVSSRPYSDEHQHHNRDVVARCDGDRLENGFGCCRDPGRTANLTQVRSGSSTCKRTSHCKDDKHGGGHDDMVEDMAACAHGPEPASACSADSEAKRIY
ncbi:hypothetical protein GW17_00032736 [Ensete ventricosum]|nr:hypothetical protein GW17_00032736 [Ensete ventricosum]